MTFAFSSCNLKYEPNQYSTLYSGLFLGYDAFIISVSPVEIGNPPDISETQVRSQARELWVMSCKL